MYMNPKSKLQDGKYFDRNIDSTLLCAIKCMDVYMHACINPSKIMAATTPVCLSTSQEKGDMTPMAT